ncbi:MAG TPA: DUF1365 domain-containing protein [Cellvibrio sp.]|nr:DUF1365 domain-containing protein [Cellvibrio sp.]
MLSVFASAIYTGKVRHRRFSPKQHAFKYDVFMMYLDTREIEEIFSLSRFWSLTHFAPAQFKRSDFHINKGHIDRGQIDRSQLAQDPLPSVDESVRNTVASALGMRPTGPIRMLVNLRYWGVNMNPISTYYCFDDSGEKLIAILAEVHNTPWNERHAYVLTGDDFSHKQHVNFPKEFHVSPFNPIDMDYRWRSTTPNETLALHLENWQDNSKIMDATMTLVREPITAKSMNKILIRFPWMTVKVVAAIYWQAVKLWWKGVPIFTHPNTLDTKQTNQHDKINNPVMLREESKL